jgi:hypothetical protein
VIDFSPRLREKWGLGLGSRMERLSPSELDEILALQLNVAWAGEAAGEPARLGWWRSDLVDPEGGGDLFARLVPRTAAWASLILVREAARRVDAVARDQLGRSDRLVTLFHWGFVVDEQLADRLAWHRREGREPEQAFGDGFLVGKPWSKEGFEAKLASFGKPRVEITPGGREVQAVKARGVELARLLAAALVPLPPKYPLPYVEGGE